MIKLYQIEALVEKRLDQLKDTRSVPGSEEIEERHVMVVPHHAQNSTNGLSCERAFREGQYLICKGEGVTHPAVCLPCQKKEGLFFPLNPFSIKNLLHSLHDVWHPHSTEIKPLAAGQNGGSSLLNLLGFCCGEDEVHPRRRFLKDLEKRIPRFAGEHVRLIDDVHFVSVFIRRRIHGPFPQVTGIFDPSIGGGVNLYYVERG